MRLPTVQRYPLELAHRNEHCLQGGTLLDLEVDELFLRIFPL